MNATDLLPPRDFNALFKRVTPQMAALDRFMRDQVQKFEPEIRDMAAYCLDTTGKRLRPTLVFVSGWQGDGIVSDELVRAAGVVEMVHLATLVHDDIMDRAEIRRNRRTAAREFGPDAAVLLGDALFSQALHVASQFPTTEVCRMVSESTRKVCSGEIMQTLRRREINISHEEYRRMIDLKTAELFRVSCFLGARLSGYAEAFADAANLFGHHLGVAYQIYDDLVDFAGEEQRIGKTLGTDLATGKLTLPLMLLLERVSESEKNEIITAIRGGKPLGLAASQQRMQELGIAGGVVLAIEKELVAATAALAPHAELPPVALMLQLCEMLRSQVAALQPAPAVK
ncbi:polyprenyl synthetase family protein [Oleiharenicola lentus]|uniref:polyprenyl synthetase family protein n=1 Tax=Oleiharenicola lentus TaxID=2508720 RepID=UPI003F66F4CE